MTRPKNLNSFVIKKILSVMEIKEKGESVSVRHHHTHYRRDITDRNLCAKHGSVVQ